MKKDLLNIYDLETADFDKILKKAAKLKKSLKEGKPHASLKGKTLGMIFDKSSTRTRISFEVGMYQLGGIALFLNSRDTQIGRGESISDSARMMSRYLDGIMIRTFSQKSVEDFWTGRIGANRRRPLRPISWPEIRTCETAATDPRRC